MTDAPTGGGGGQTPVHPDDLDGLRIRWIRTQGQLDRAERLNLAEGHRWAFATHRTLEQLLDDRWLFELHRRSFGEVWSWAGTPRVRATSIGIDPAQVPRATRDALLDAAAQLEADPDGLHRRELIARLHHRLAAIHPFANGNGRTLRTHGDLLARSLGVTPPTWGAGRPDARSEYLAALREADRGAIEPLESFIWS
jgi:Fic-DOC domain mobile mystery protein B